MTDRKLFTMVLDALDTFDKGNHGMRWQVPLVKALRARLSTCDRCGKVNPAELHTCTLPQREWVSLTDDYIDYAAYAICRCFDIDLKNQININSVKEVIKVIEDKCQENNK